MSRTIHLIGIGGTGMASLAGLLQQKGHRVQGSDGPIYPPMSEVLADLGVKIFEGYAPENLDPAPDLVVVGNAIPRGNPELEAALDQDLPYTSMPRVLADEIMAGRERIVISGTHGKTTTTTLTALILHAAELGPGWLVGGLPIDLPANHSVGRSGSPFIVEGDEYDTAYFDKGPKFHHYLPRRLVINAVEFDHADIYEDLDAIELQFRRLVHVVPRNGRVVACADDAGALRVSQATHAPRVTFGVGPRPARGPRAVTPDFWATELEAGPEGIQFQLQVRGEDKGIWGLGMLGTFNVRNALAAIAATEGMGLDENIVREALMATRGVRRRLELRGTIGNVRLYDDFAHHPTAITGAVEALDLPEGRLIAVLEPRSWTLRRRVFETEIAESLRQADVAIIAPVYRPDRLEDDIRLEPLRVVEHLERNGTSAHAPADTESIVRLVSEIARPGDRVLVMSNGGFDGIHQRILDALS